MKITYLFGAGASKQALPIVNEIPERIKKVISYLKLGKYKLSDSEKFEDLKLDLFKFDIQKVLIEDLEWLLLHSKNHASIDTFAKKLFIKNDEEGLIRLKASFSVYFIIEQLLNKPDMRYDSFFASILSSNISSFPENIRILSWNYDSQFEIAFSEYTNSKSFEISESFLNLKTKFYHDNSDNSKFCLLKLNGTTNILKNSGFTKYNFIHEIDNKLTIENLGILVRNFGALKFNNTLFSGLSFSWETFGRPEYDIKLHSINETKDTETLIVIGYSFPYFNRVVDREIIGSMKTLKKVYFQSPDPENLKERFLSIRDDIKNEDLVCRKNVDQFLLPNEL